MTKPTIFLLTAVHNNLDKTKKLLKCIEGQTYKNYRIFVVDDGSTDKTSKFIQTQYPSIKLISGNGNLWWTGSLFLGVNEILKVAQKKDLVLTINNDCQFDRSYFQNFIKTHLTHPNSIIGSLVVDHNSRIWDAGVKIDWKKGQIYGIYQIGQKINEIKKNKKDHIQRNIDTISTKGTIYPLNLFKKIGNFDRKNFPHYLSDYEFGIRAKKFGYDLIIDYNLKLVNDTTNTGFGDDIKFELKEFSKVLFNRRSRVNIIDQINFIWICCPKKYMLQNYLFLILRGIKRIVR